MRVAGGAGFTRLSPRQALTPAPYALQALKATTAESMDAADLTGLVSDGQLSTNVALLSTSPQFIGSVIASNFIGSGAGLTQLGTSFAVNRLATTNDIYIFDGDSRTADEAPPSASWPECALTNLFFACRWAYWTNVAVSATTMSDATARYPVSVKPHKPMPGQNAYLFEALGINDLLNLDASTLLSTKIAYWRAAQADGFKVITATVPPADDGFSNAVVYPRALYSAFDQNRRQFNALVRTCTVPDGVLDFDAVINDLNDSDLYVNRVHFTQTAKAALGAYASTYMMTLGRGSISEPASPLYPRWKATLPLRYAPFLQAGVKATPYLPGGDQGGTMGLYDTLLASPGSFPSFVEHVPHGAGWTNVTVKLLLTTDSTRAACFSVTINASALNTNTLAALSGPGAVHSAQKYSLTNLIYPQFATATFSLSWSNDYSPRQLMVLFSDLTGSLPLKNNVYVLDMDAMGY